jgi:hypothetical protein
MFKKRQMPMYPMQGQPMMGAMDPGMGGQQMPQMPMQQMPQMGQMPMPQMPMQQMPQMGQMPLQGGAAGTNYDVVRLQTEIRENRRLINDLYRRVVRLENYLGIRSEAETENKNSY